MRQMAGKIFRRLLGSRSGAPPPGDLERQQLIEHCRTAPADPARHFALAQLYLARGQHLLANACYRTALSLGASTADAIERELASGGLFVPGKAASDGTVTPAFVEGLLEFQRLSRVADCVRTRLAGRAGNVLDVGGGNGALALLLPACNYFLVEPEVNGLLSDDAVRFGRRFDVVTCCHVFEHIPEEKKPAFLASLASPLADHIVLLGPSVDECPPPRVDELFHKITGAQWAAEHIACRWPRIADIRAFARTNALDCQVSKNGDLAATYWMVFAFHYAALADRNDELKGVVEFYNREIWPDPRAKPPPNDYLVELSRPARVHP